ncbi:hypothetical protein RBSWK_04966 [Rhodopirellula baltica SWK14]|uniref:Uncharacterized protein n=1 Tax=Rhodopirellula baltica SWK14 TaxID=993516 RepID=L7CB23_RHOBT|nr:hypothetical protein RBSWK_04966 [Rhodopirellula baltica SWK14]
MVAERHRVELNTQTYPTPHHRHRSNRFCDVTPPFPSPSVPDRNDCADYAGTPWVFHGSSSKLEPTSASPAN